MKEQWVRDRVLKDIVLRGPYVLSVRVPAHSLFSGMLWVAGIEESDVSRPKVVVPTHSVLTLGFIIATIRTYSTP